MQFLRLNIPQLFFNSSISDMVFNRFKSFMHCFYLSFLSRIAYLSCVLATFNFWLWTRIKIINNILFRYSSTLRNIQLLYGLFLHIHNIRLPQVQHWTISLQWIYQLALQFSNRVCYVYNVHICYFNKCLLNEKENNCCFGCIVLALVIKNLNEICVFIMWFFKLKIV